MLGIVDPGESVQQGGVRQDLAFLVAGRPHEVDRLLGLLRRQSGLEQAGIGGVVLVLVGWIVALGGEQGGVALVVESGIVIDRHRGGADDES